MPQYKVIAPGFYDGKMYAPEGKRRVLHTDMPFNKKNPMPSWVEEMKSETAAAKKKREAAEKKAAGADAEKAEQDEKDIQDASFMGDGEAGSSVETL